MKSLMKIIALFLVINLNLHAQVDMKTTGQGGVNLKQTGQTTMNFLQISVSPKASALGNAFTAISKGVESVFANPAGLPEMNSKYEAFVSSTQWFADIKYLSGAVAWNGEEYGAVALSFLLVDYGTIRGTALVDAASTSPENYILTGDVKNVGAYAFGLTYVKKISPKFAIGGTAKYVGQQLGQSVDAAGNVSDNRANKWVFDMGIKYFPGIESLRLGMSMRNFSTFVRYQSFSSPLPIAFAVGLGMNIMDLINKKLSEEHSLLVSSEFIHPNNYTDRVNAGVEYTYLNMISLRAGYESNHDIFSWSGGVGIKQSIGGVKFDINYSYSATEYFDGVNRFSLSVAF